MNEAQELVRGVRKLNDQLGDMRDELFIPLKEISKNLNRLAEAAWTQVQLLKKEQENGRNREKQNGTGKEEGIHS